MSVPLVNLEEFTGNRELCQTLARIELPAVSLFAGPGGVGKKTLAATLAARLSCAGPEPKPCRQCSSCVKVRGRNHPDVLLIDREWVETTMKNLKKTYNPRVITIDVARAVIREAQYRPFESARRVFILDEVEKLNTSASNALLKTLEEPLASSHFVLVTAHPEQLLPTILSRCQRFTFQGLSRAEIASHLKAREVDDPESRAAFSQGSIGRALDLDVERLLADRDGMLKLLLAWSGRHLFAPVFKACHEPPLAADLKDRERTLELLEQLSLLGEDLYYLTRGQPERVVSQDRLEELQCLQRGLTMDWIEKFLYHVRQAGEDVRRYITPLVCFETVWLETLNEHA